MRCINKRALCGLLTAALLAVSGCGNKAAEIKNPYPVYSTAVTDSLIAASGEGSNVLSYFATNLCVGGLENTGLENTDEQVCEGAGLFNTATHEIPYAKNIYEQL